MPIFIVETEEDKAIDQFMSESDERLQKHEVSSQVFYGQISKLRSKGFKNFYVVEMHPVFPPFYMFGLLGAAIPFVFGGFVFTWWMLPGLFIYSLGIFWSKPFYLFILKLGMRKAGCRKKVKCLSSQDMVLELLGNISWEK